MLSPAERKGDRSYDGYLLEKQDTQPAGRRDDIHEIVYEEDAQEAPEVEETRVTSSDFDKINVTDMHQVTMQEAVGEASYEDIPVEEVSSAATFKSLLNAESPGRRKRRF